MIRTTATLMTAALTWIIVGLATPMRSEAGQPNFCRMSSQNMLQACQAGATEDQAVALARCQNMPDAAARKMCRQAAAAETKEARMSCQDQREARQEVCAEVGPAPYNPVIDPANFVAMIDNPLLPARAGYDVRLRGRRRRTASSTTSSPSPTTPG